MGHLPPEKCINGSLMPTLQCSALRTQQIFHIFKKFVLFFFFYFPFLPLLNKSLCCRGIPAHEKRMKRNDSVIVWQQEEGASPVTS